MYDSTRMYKAGCIAISCFSDSDLNRPEFFIQKLDLRRSNLFG